VSHRRHYGDGGVQINAASCPRSARLILD
jgi:hypothetical protein